MPSEETTYRKSVQEKLDSILEQTKKTNGRVTKLEKQFLILATGLICTVALKYPEFKTLLLALIG